jgi:hypothetical protein
MNFWEIVLAVIVGNLFWTLVTLPFTVVVGVLVGILKGLSS